MRKIIIIFSVLSAILLFGIATAFSGFKIGKKVEQNNIFSMPDKNSGILWRLILEWRRNNNLPEYTWNDTLCKIAAVRIQQIRSDWSHDKFSKDSSDPKSYMNILLQKYKWKIIGENLAKDFTSEKETLEGWLGSPLHLENLKRDYTDSCVITDGGRSVQIFLK